MILDTWLETVQTIHSSGVQKGKLIIPLVVVGNLCSERYFMLLNRANKKFEEVLFEIKKIKIETNKLKKRKK